MPIIKIDGKDYDTDDLSEETKAQLGSLQFVQSELARLQAQAAALQTAQIAYGKALKETLETGKRQLKKKERKLRAWAKRLSLMSDLADFCNPARLSRTPFNKAVVYKIVALLKGSVLSHTLFNLLHC